MSRHRSSTALPLSATGTPNSQLDYGKLLQHVYDRRRSAPGNARDPNKVASNTRRALEAFIEANDLDEASLVGEELLGAGLEQALSRLSNLNAARDTRRRWRSEIKERVRPWAIEEARRRSEPALFTGGAYVAPSGA